MKTFEEALTTVVVCEKADAPPERLEKLSAEMLDRMERVRPLLRETIGHAFLESVLEATHRAGCCPQHRMLNAFQLGLQVGMEMERSETGGVLVE